MKIKVLIINSVPTERNGITNVIFNYLSNMDVDGIQFDLISINEPEDRYSGEVENKGGKLFVVERIRGKEFSYYKQVKTIIKENQYDIVHVHGNSHTLVLELLAAWIGHCKVRVAHAHNTTCNSVLLHRLLSPLFCCLCTDGLACGEDAGRWMFGNKAFKVLNNGVDLNLFAFSRTKRELFRNKYGLNGTKVIGHVGMFIPAKNQGYILDVFTMLLQTDETYRLMLIGDGPLMEETKTRVNDKGISDKVIFTGGIHNVNELLNAIDVIIMPSLYEGLPLALIEQQANGLQCVVSDTITKEVNKTGNVVFLPLDDLALWTSTINKLDCLQGRTERSRAACEDIVKAGYSIAEEAKKLDSYYKNLLGRR